MAHKIAVSTLNASTVDILNVIRENASLAYQSSVPEVEQEADIPRVGAVIYGTPAFSNEFINALVNRIALVRVDSATFNNPYERLKKGVLDYGESIEDIFVNIVKVYKFSQEKAASREFQRFMPDVRSAFHVMNWRVVYPLTISDEELRMAFLSADGVTNLIARMVDSIYTAANYDEFLLYKYMLIKSVAKGAFKPQAVNGATPSNYAKAFRGASNKLPFMSSEYNVAGVKNTTPKERQVIFMDAQFNADFDVDVLASAFNMDKADFMGSLFLIDNWTEFDNERWEEIRAESDGIEEVTAAELAMMQDVKAVLVDENWFQFYDNLTRMTEKFVAAGLRWNYFYHTWKTISYSPYANALVFLDGTITAPTNIKFKVDSVQIGDNGAFAMSLVPTTATVGGSSVPFEGFEFVQTEAAVNAGVAVLKYGGYMWDGVTGADDTGDVIATVKYRGVTYVSANAIIDNHVPVDAGTEITLTPAT
jgi:hypothetical protein